MFRLKKEPYTLKRGKLENKVDNRKTVITKVKCSKMTKSYRMSAILDINPLSACFFQQVFLTHQLIYIYTKFECYNLPKIEISVM